MHAHQENRLAGLFDLASYFIVEDDEEKQLAKALDLKFGETDIPLVIQDKTFDNSGNSIYSTMLISDGSHEWIFRGHHTDKSYL